MDNIEKALYIDQFLLAVNKTTIPVSIIEGIENDSDLSDEEIRNLEHCLEDLDLVKFVSGRDNSTVNGYCQYLISRKGREFCQAGRSSLILFKDNNFIEDLLATEISTNPMYDKTVWDNHYDSKIDKRIAEADFFIDVIVSENLLNLDKETIRKYFKQWFKDYKGYDIQIKNGGFAIEDGAIQIVPDFEKTDVLQFIAWFNTEKKHFTDFMEEQGATIPKNVIPITNHISSSGNIIINQDSKIKNQNIATSENTESNWTKSNVIITAIIGFTAIAVTIWLSYK